MAQRSTFPAAALGFWSILSCLLVLRAEVRQPQEESLYLWIDAHQARVLIGFEEDILIVSEGKMAPFTHDFRKAQQRMPAIPVNIHSMNFTWQAAGQRIREDGGTGMEMKLPASFFSPVWVLITHEDYLIMQDNVSTTVKLSPSLYSVGSGEVTTEYFYEFLSLRSLDKGIMADPTVNVPLLGTVPHKASVVQVGFPCLGKQDGVAAFEVNVIITNSEGNTILQTPPNAIFFKTCQQAECPGGCRNGGFCNERRICECPDGFYGPHCEKALCTPRCMNGGLCVTPGFCICPPGFYGVNCDKANCSTTCFNGGTCFYPGKCICPPGLEGEQCEISKCPQPCRNGGKCIGKNKCKCSKGYQGDLCSKPVCEPGCGPHGTCHEPNECQCQEGWHGRHCNKMKRTNERNLCRSIPAFTTSVLDPYQRWVENILPFNHIYPNFVSRASALPKYIVRHLVEARFDAAAVDNFAGYGASLMHALRPAGTKLRQHTPSPKKAEERQDPPESNYIW